MQSSTFPRLAVATALALTFVHAQADNIADGQQVAALDPVVVTAARTPQTVNETLAAVTVLGREDIDRSQAIDLPSLLDRQPGLTMTRNGSFGQSSSLFIRGTESDHSLVMIDGLRIGSATTGQAAFEHIPLHDLESLEIVRGPRSSIYGSDAIGGVVQMFTRGERMVEGQRLRGGMMVGGNNTTEITAGLDAGDGDREISVSARKFDTDGIKVTEDSLSDNGFENDSASVRYRQRLGNNAEWRLNALHSEGVAESSGNATADRFSEFLQQAVSTELMIDATDWWRTNLQAGQSRDESDSFLDDAPRTLDSRFNTKRDEFNWTNELFIGANSEFITGVDVREERVDSTTDFDEDSRYNVGAYGVYLWEGERADFEISGRRDKNEAFGYSTTGGVASGYRIGETTRIRGAVGTAFNAPTFNSLYFPFLDFGAFGSFQGNPDLDPEESITYEIGIEGGRDTRWGINVFRTEIDDLIANIDTTGAGDLTPQNLDEATIDGVELSATALDVEGWRLQATATWLDPVAKGQDGEDDTKLARRPQRKVTFDADREMGRGSIGLTLRHEGGRFDDAANNDRLSPFTLVDMRMGYRFSDSIRLRGSVENVTDRDYQTIEGFNTLGRTFFLRLDYRG